MYKNWLATDLDGTFIPLPQHPENLSDLGYLKSVLQEAELGLAFVTGRHLASVQHAIESENLPEPDWIICDVGSSIYHFENGEPVLVDAYQQALAQITQTWTTDLLEEQFASITELRKQEPEKQTNNKLSFYIDAASIEATVARIQNILREQQIPWGVINSVDPFNGDGLIDLLPIGVNKAFAIQWWADFIKVPTDQLIFAGDSGNDLAAFEHGYRTIVVANTDRQIANRVFWTHEDRGTSRQLFLADRQATSGVVEGLRWFDAIPEVAISDQIELGWKNLGVNRSQFAVWAPNCESVQLKWQSNNQDEQLTTLSSEDGQVFHADVPAGPGTEYHLLLNGKDARPDPRSKLQAADVHGPSVSVNPRYAWTDGDWNGIAKKDLVLYELHVGTFSEIGTYEGILNKLDELVQLGVTAIELLPVATCPGKWNWGYDGVHLFAPTANYGSPAQLRRLVDACHQKGLAVILDVVYNHLGPEGNYLSNFGPYFTKRHGTPWGDALNYDGPDSQQVRKLIVDNAVYWLKEFHFDGLRLDAIHFMFDNSEYSITQEICDAVGELQKTTRRKLHLIGEANIFDDQLIDSGSEHSYAAIWADCLMHSVYSHGVPEISLAHRKYCGLDDIHETLTHGYLYSGPKLQRATRDSDATSQLPAEHLSSLIMALQTHDSVGNHPHGKRLAQLTNIDFQKAATSLFLLYPALPMIFMGEEFAADSPFRFFADFLDEGLRRAVDRGRQKEYPNHQWKGAIAPSNPEAFTSSKLAPIGEEGRSVRSWYQELLRLRKQGLTEGWLDSDLLSIHFDAQSHRFQLHYHRPEIRWTVDCQLIAPKDESLVGDEIPLMQPTGPVFLDSWQYGTKRTGSSRAVVSFLDHS